MTKAREIVNHFKKGMGILSEAMPETIPASGECLSDHARRKGSMEGEK